MKGQLLGGGTAIRPLPGSPSAHPRQLPAAQGRVNPGVPPARSDGKAGKEAGPPPPPKGAAGLIFAAELGLGAQREHGCGCWGGQSSASRPGGSGPFPSRLTGPCSIAGSAAEPSFGCSIFWRGGKSSSASPPLPSPCLQPKAESSMKLQCQVPTMFPRTPQPHRAQTCLSLLLPANPARACPAHAVPLRLAALPAPCQPRSARARRELAGGGFWSERAHPVPSGRWAQV